MTDYLFRELLNRRANLTRPQIQVDGRGLPRQPEPELLAARVPLRLRPVRASLDAGLLGRLPRAEAVAYLEPRDLRAADRLGVIGAVTTLAAAAEAGATVLTVTDPAGLEPGCCLHLRAEDCFAEVVVESREEPAVTLRAPLPVAVPEDADVERVEPWEVLGVGEAAGAGHHLRVAVRRE